MRNDVPLPPVRPWTVEEYHRAIDAGIFGPDERLELLEGMIVSKMAHKGPHATGITLCQTALLAVFQAGYVVRIQLPLTLTSSEPEPDLAVVMGSPRDFLRVHPTSAFLVIEVADSSLDVDRTTKAGIYARAGIQDYWILNLVDERLDVYRDPRPDEEQPLGFQYRSVVSLGCVDAVSPLQQPAASIAVRDLLP